MRLFISVFLFLCFFVDVSAQFGLRVGATSFLSSASDQNYSEIGPEVAVHYWTRLKEHRIEFYPEVMYSTYRNSDFRFVQDFTYAFRRIGLGVPIRIYPLDFVSDCNCPTFSKQNDLFEKGFFVFVAPSANVLKLFDLGYRLEDWVGAPDHFNDWSLDFDIGFGLGLDIGISDLVTITPNVQYRPKLFGEENFFTRASAEVNFSITATFRPDY